VTAIIFGASGQDGFFLKKILLASKLNVISVSRTSGDILGDVSNYSFVSDLIKQKKPNYIFHFAAISSTAHQHIFSNNKAINEGTVNILESVKNHSIKSRVFLSGSAMQFKNNGLAINELSDFDHSSPYSVSRIYSTYCGRYYRERFNIKVYIGYFFNHDSHLRNENHINKMIVNKVKNISEGSIETIFLGDVNVKKEFNYAGDLMHSVWKLVNQDNLFEFVLGSGKAYKILDWIIVCFDLIGVDYTNYLSTNKKYVKEYDILVSDPRLINSIDKRAKVDIKKLAKLMFENKYEI
jgi:GDPmannose 4,6-dehydratase